MWIFQSSNAVCRLNIAAAAHRRLTFPVLPNSHVPVTSVQSTFAAPESFGLLPTSIRQIFTQRPAKSNSMADSKRRPANGKKSGDGRTDPGRNKHHSGRGRVGDTGDGPDSSCPDPSVKAYQEGTVVASASGAISAVNGAPNNAVEGKSSTSSHLSDVRFDSLKGRLDRRVLAAVPYEFMSVVQAATIDASLSGVDVLAAARTGTGKTLAFLLPAIQRLTKIQRRRRDFVYVLILSPTRELATQIKREANMLLRDFKKLGAQTAVGGTALSAESKRLAKGPCNVLVATPGRLLDHLSSSDWAEKLSCLCVVVLDEADRMLDMGFRYQLEQIKARLPDRGQAPRQSLLFSATFPKSLLEVADVLPNHKFINTVPDDEQNTHEHVCQAFQIVPKPDVLPLTLAHILYERQSRPGQAKIIAFFPTARTTQLAYEVMSKIPGLGPMWEFHSRSSQPQRDRANDEFRQSFEGVLFSSDVGARGIDFPNVSLVIQAGVPSSSDQYIHRLGRTARAGAAGRGVLILADFEDFFLSEYAITKLPLQPLDVSQAAIIGAVLTQSRQSVASALTSLSDESKVQAYQASLGYYRARLKHLRWSQTDLVAKMNEFARQSLLYRGAAAPPLLERTVRKMGLWGTPGLNVVRAQKGAGKAKRDSGRGVSGAGQA